MSWYPGPQIDWTDLEICHIDPYVPKEDSHHWLCLRLGTCPGLSDCFMCPDVFVFHVYSLEYMSRGKIPLDIGTWDLRNEDEA